MRGPAVTARPRIALIHATPVAVEPIAAAFAMLWPEAEPVNILDNSLSVDRAKSAALTAALEVRIGDLAVYGRSIGADAILFTCSAFGAAIERAGKTLDVPVLKPNEAMFEEALAFGDRIGMIATFAPAVATMEAEFVEDARRFRPTARLATCLAADAMSALRSGDAETHNQLVAERCAVLTDVDAVMLAHFSTARALEASRAIASWPVLSSPAAAVRKLRRLLSSQ